MTNSKRMEITIDQNKKAVEAYEAFMAYINFELYTLYSVNDTGFFDREIELLEKIKQSGINYSSIYKKD